MTIKAEEKLLGRVFSDDYVFEIPEYQRPYAWTTEQAGELLDDLLTAAAGDANSSYFLGSIVLIKEPDVPLAQVVDGQQRLTTLTILLCVLRDLTANAEHRLELDDRVRSRPQELAGISGPVPSEPEATRSRSSSGITCSRSARSNLLSIAGRVCRTVSGAFVRTPTTYGVRSLVQAQKGASNSRYS